MEQMIEMRRKASMPLSRSFIQGMCIHYIIYDQGRILEPISRFIYILIQLNVDSLNPFANNVIDLVQL